MPRAAANAKRGRAVVNSLLGDENPEIFDVANLIAQILITSGVDFASLQTYLQRVYVLASSRYSNFRNKRPNQSGIAAMTGLTRAEVKRILSMDSDVGAADTRDEPRGVERVIHGWANDREFLSATGKSLSLGRGKGKGTFDALVARYGNDVPVAAVLRELVRRNRVILSNNIVKLRAPTRQKKISGAAKTLLSSAIPILTALVPSNAHDYSIDAQSIDIELPESISLELLKSHLKVAVPIFFEQARIAANGVLLSKRKRNISKKGKTVRLDLISVIEK